MVDENESIEASSTEVDKVDKNEGGEASGTTSDEVPREKTIRFLRYVYVEQVTDTLEQQLSAAPETAEQVVNVPDDAAQSAQQRTAEQVVNVPDETETATQLDRDPLQFQQQSDRDCHIDAG